MSKKIKFYTDEHVPLAVVDGLLRRGIDVLTTFCELAIVFSIYL